MNIKNRLRVLEQARDAKCAECWEQAVVAATHLLRVLKRHDIPMETAGKYITGLHPLTNEERTALEAVLPEVQDEVEALQKVDRDYGERPGCHEWFDRTHPERVLEQELEAECP